MQPRMATLVISGGESVHFQVPRLLIDFVLYRNNYHPSGGVYCTVCSAVFTDILTVSSCRPRDIRQTDRDANPCGCHLVIEGRGSIEVVYTTSLGIHSGQYKC